jgi:hypothetical protein
VLSPQDSCSIGEFVKEFLGSCKWKTIISWAAQGIPSLTNSTSRSSELMYFLFLSLGYWLIIDQANANRKGKRKRTCWWTSTSGSWVLLDYDSTSHLVSPVLVFVS